MLALSSTKCRSMLFEPALGPCRVELRGNYTFNDVHVAESRRLVWFVVLVLQSKTTSPQYT